MASASAREKEDVVNTESWQAGLILGTAFVIVLEVGVRTLLWRLRVRKKKKRCDHCAGFLGEDGRAEIPVERLQCCAWCGDTWLAGARSEYEHPDPGYRDSAKDALQELIDLSLSKRSVPGPGMERLGMHLYRPNQVPSKLQPSGSDISQLREALLQAARDDEQAAEGRSAGTSTGVSGRAKPQGPDVKRGYS